MKAFYRHAGSRSFGIYPFNSFITHPELGDINTL
jgi:hypothetical protein